MRKHRKRSSVVLPSVREPSGFPLLNPPLQSLYAILEMLLGQAFSGDEQLGYFFASLITRLNKRTSRLAQENKAFKACYAKLESARYATKRSSGVREHIHQIMFEADSIRGMFKLSKHLAETTPLEIEPNHPVIQLPPPDSRSKTAIIKWSGYVYPELRKRQHDLASQPGIGDRKRYQIDGKFQISRLRDRIPPDVKRIFKVWEAERSAWAVLSPLKA